MSEAPIQGVQPAVQEVKLTSLQKAILHPAGQVLQVGATVLPRAVVAHLLHLADRAAHLQEAVAPVQVVEVAEAKEDSLLLKRFIDL